jgi:hypothetical protein
MAFRMPAQGSVIAAVRLIYPKFSWRFNRFGRQVAPTVSGGSRAARFLRPVQGSASSSRKIRARPSAGKGSRPLRQTTGILRIQTPGRGLVEISRDVASWQADQAVCVGLLTLF